MKMESELIENIIKKVEFETKIKLDNLQKASLRYWIDFTFDKLIKEKELFGDVKDDIMP